MNCRHLQPAPDEVHKEQSERYDCGSRRGQQTERASQREVEAATSLRQAAGSPGKACMCSLNALVLGKYAGGLEPCGLLYLVKAFFGVLVALLDQFRDLVDLMLLLVDQVGEVPEDFVHFMDALIDFTNLLLAFLEDGVIDSLLLHGDLKLDALVTDHDVQVAGSIGGAELGAANAMRLLRIAAWPASAEGLHRRRFPGQSIAPALFELIEHTRELLCDTVAISLKLGMGNTGPRLLRPRQRLDLPRKLRQASPHRGTQLLDHVLLARHLAQ